MGGYFDGKELRYFLRNDGSDKPEGLLRLGAS
jgi:hypothetical protein